MNNNMKFILTQSNEARQNLLNNGFTELPNSDEKLYVFLNNGKIVFDNQQSDCVYTNKLFI